MANADSIEMAILPTATATAMTALLHEQAAHVRPAPRLRVVLEHVGRRQEPRRPLRRPRPGSGSRSRTRSRAGRRSRPRRPASSAWTTTAPHGDGPPAARPHRARRRRAAASSTRARADRRSQYVTFFSAKRNWSMVSPMTTRHQDAPTARPTSRGCRPMNPSFHSLYTMISVAWPGPPWVTAWMTPNELEERRTPC